MLVTPQASLGSFASRDVDLSVDALFPEGFDFHVREFLALAWPDADSEADAACLDYCCRTEPRSRNDHTQCWNSGRLLGPVA